MTKLSEFTNELMARGQCCFTVNDAIVRLGKNYKTVLSAIERLMHKGELVSPARSFYVLVPPQYRVLGCIPAEQFLPQLMELWHCPYYVALLSAARFHGATHQAVQVMQVMVEKKHPPIHCGKVSIRFLVNRHLSETPTQKVTTPKSILTISTPEGTAMDLFRYSDQAGGLNHVITVLEELVDAMTPAKLEAVLFINAVLPWKQRLGYCLEQLNQNELADVVFLHLSSKRRVDYLLLNTKIPNKTGQRDKRWKIIINTDLESDL